jgi:hypothetical protein
MAAPIQPFNWHRLLPQACDPRISQLLAGQQAIIALLQTILKELQMSQTITQQMDAAITQLEADVTAQKGVVASNTALLEGFAAALQTAINNSLNSGATDAELASVIALHTSVAANTDGLVAAAVANPLPPTP